MGKSAVVLAEYAEVFVFFLSVLLKVQGYKKCEFKMESSPMGSFFLKHIET